jgi:hypothetical protein
MKKISIYFLVLFASLFIALQSFGQSDSIKINLNISGEVLKKLDSKDIVEIIKFKEKLALDEEMAAKAKVPTKFEPNAISITIWILMSWSFFLILISIPFYFNHKKIKQRQLIINSLIEKGQQIPEELIAPSSKSVRSDFHKGVILIALGVSVVIVLLSLKIANNFWTIGLIPMLIGISYLVSFKFDKPNKIKSELD